MVLVAHTKNVKGNATKTNTSIYAINMLLAIQVFIIPVWIQTIHNSLHIRIQQLIFKNYPSRLRPDDFANLHKSIQILITTNSTLID